MSLVTPQAGRDEERLAAAGRSPGVFCRCHTCSTHQAPAKYAPHDLTVLGDAPIPPATETSANPRQLFVPIPAPPPIGFTSTLSASPCKSGYLRPHPIPPVSLWFAFVFF